MKRLILPLVAALCSSFAASATDATDARMWMEEKDASKITTRVWGDAKGIGRTGWQYIAIPVEVEGVLKGKDSAPHFIPEMKVHVYALFSTSSGKGDKEYTLLDKELTYVEIPLESKSADKNKGNASVKLGVFVSPGNAYKIATKDGILSKRLVALAVEATFKGAPCVRRESGNRSIVQHVVFDNTLDLKNNWWRSKSSFKGDCGAFLHSIAETPYAAEYIDLGMPALSPMYGSGSAGSSSSSSSSSSTTSSTTTSDSESGGPVSVTDSDTDTSSDTSSDTSATEEEESSSKGSKRSKRTKGSKKRR